MRSLGLLLTLLAVSPQAATDQTPAVAPGTIITSAHVTGFVPSAGVTITANLSGNGWNAQTSHTATSKVCDIYAGDLAVSLGLATVEGEPKCTP